MYSSYLISHDMTIVIYDDGNRKSYNLQGSAVTMDFRTDRVRVYTNEHGVVTQKPIIG